MFGLGVPELIIILVVVLLIFGPRKLPELGSFVGKSLKDFREALDTRGEDDGEPPPQSTESSASSAASSAASPAEPVDQDPKV